MTTPDTQVLSTYKTDLEVKLHPEEVHDHAKRLAAIEQEMAQHQERAKSIKADLAAKEAALKAERSTVALKVRTEKEVRPVACTITAHWNTNTAITTRDDTRAVIASRPLSAAERQAVMNLGESKSIVNDLLAGAKEKPESVIGEVERKPCTATALAGLCTVHGSDCPDKDTLKDREVQPLKTEKRRMPIVDVEPDPAPNGDDDVEPDEDPEGEDEVNDE